MVRFFEWCGYNVSSPDKWRNPILNCIDISLVIIYTILSGMNLKAATPSLLLLLINAVTLSRFILKNLIEQFKVVGSGDDKNKGRITIVHIVKICAGFIIMLMLAIFLTWSICTTGDLAIIKPIVAIVLGLTFVENIWVIMEQLYGAVPKPLSY